LAAPRLCFPVRCATDAQFEVIIYHPSGFSSINHLTVVQLMISTPPFVLPEEFMGM
jgi:hypothetical protein